MKIMKIEHNSRLDFYRNPFGAVTSGTEVQLRLAVSDAGIPSSVQLIYQIDGENEIAADMPYEMTVNGSSVYFSKIKMPDEPCLVWYWFKLVYNHNETVWYGNNHSALGGEGDLYEHKPDKAFQITVYSPEFKTPDWFKKSVAYQIFPDRFFNGNADGSFLGERSDIIKRNWGEQPFYKAEQFGGEYKANDFFGGNLLGITQKLPYLADLGISVIYLNPIFCAYSNHKYDTGSYEETDPMFGTEEDFKSLCEKAETYGIRIILDGVFNHTGADSMYFNKNGTYDSLGAYQSQKSPYYGWYRFSEWPEEYESWWGMKTLPQVEEQNEEYRKYLLSGDNAIIKKWLKNGASGWRLDVADELPDFFIEELRENAKAEKEDAVIIGEVWEDASSKVAYGERRKYFMGNGLDSVMNYPMRNALIDAVLGKIGAEELDMRLMSLKENYPPCAYYSLLNMVSSHDVERVMTLLSGAPPGREVDRDFQANYYIDENAYNTARMRLYVLLAMQMTLPGVPCIFYGDEIGMTGYGDPFCRAAFPWDDLNKYDSTGNVFEAYKRLIALRNENSAFSEGEFETIYKLGGVYAYIRYAEDKFITAVNMGESFERVRFDTARFGVNRLESIFGGEETDISDDGIFFVDLPPVSVRIYEAK